MSKNANTKTTHKSRAMKFFSLPGLSKKTVVDLSEDTGVDLVDIWISFFTPGKLILCLLMSFQQGTLWTHYWGQSASY